jgi:hypothetical protein
VNVSDPAACREGARDDGGVEGRGAFGVQVGQLCSMFIARGQSSIRDATARGSAQKIVLVEGPLPR